ncbi:hypothetical protein CHS0354_025593 [Potamilus streckersoni]|uniref:Uncharacterized protein n=1 Tax=Potamilus streckersoni TaxID=2493646 RepID=A0AAE0S161_9BIVA|nr:hypothetical protein CHS0354_025593 [Potamilus streckersoni]
MMATGSGKYTSLNVTPLTQSVLRQRKHVNVGRDVQFLVSSTQREADRDDAHVLGARSDDLRFETIKEGGPDNVKADSYNRNTHAVSKSMISLPAVRQLKTINTLITEKC